ncbi:MAG: hypothetical protein QOD41_2070 [Cryptosporangiaceae bacterium]|nr:hypothetical protein [Cryptosporangiaceae bacterium]
MSLTRNPVPARGVARVEPPARRLSGRRRIALGAAFSVLALLVAALGGGYGALSVPLPTAAAVTQTSTVVYADGTTPLALFATEDREIVPLSRVPIHVQRAVLAAEDRSFYSHGGVSPTGIARALVGLATGEDRGGGSTITQQYIKNSRLTQERTFGRKAKEIVMAIKADQEFSKNRILELYLNTIFFGRGAFGIQTAAKAYFGKDVSKLTPEQGAVLAAVIKDPTNLDPRNNPAGAKKRWDYVIGGMAEQGWYPRDKVASAAYPTASAPKRHSWQDGQNGVLADAVVKEISRSLRIDTARTEKLLDDGGYTVLTTVDATAQKAAAQAAAGALAGQDPSIGSALVAVEPSTGRIKAYYGGTAGYGRRDLAGRSRPHPPGSSMRPYGLARAASDLPDDDSADSILAAARKAGGEGAKEVAAKAGITVLGTGEGTKPIGDVTIDDSIGIGRYPVAVVEQASGYATFAARGTHRDPYLVDRIADRTGRVVYRHRSTATTAFPERSALLAGKIAQATDQSGEATALPGVAVSGTQDGNADLWICGYTDQLATAVWVGHQDTEAPLVTDGGEPMDTSTPVSILQRFTEGTTASAADGQT